MFLAGNLVLGQGVGVNPAGPMTKPSGQNYNTAASADNNNGWGLRFAWTPTYYDVSGVKSASIIIPPRFPCFMGGKTLVRANDGVDYTAFEVGLEKSFRSNWRGTNWSIMPKLGFDAQISLLSQEANGSDRALFQVKQRTSYPGLPAGCFVYDKLTPGIFTPIPFIGMDVNLGGWTISPEIGLSCKEFRREYGNIAGKSFVPTGSSDEWAFSVKPTLSVGYKFKKNLEIELSGSYENYKYGFGRIQDFSLSPRIIWKFW
jgi:hypothetical protein